MRIILALLLLSTSAFAQARPIDWSNGACYADGVYFPARLFGQCIASDRGAYSQTMPPSNLMGSVLMLSATVVGTNTFVTNVTRSCPKDRTLVMIDSGTYKCAKDLTDPE